MFFIYKAYSFIKRDFLQDVSYKFAFLMQIFGIIFSITTFFFLSKLFGNTISPYLEPYGGDYFSFVLIGIAFGSYLSVAMESLTRSIRDAQLMGTLECLLVTQTEIPTIVVSSSLYSFFLTSLRVILYLVFGVLIFGMELHNANYPAALFILMLTIISFSSLGILSASFIMIVKKGNPIATIFTNVSWLLGGVYYPISILPDWLQNFSFLLPITYSLEGMRLALIKGYSFGELLYPNILGLVLFTIIVFPISLYTFYYAVRIAKKHGSLTHY